MHLMSCVEPVLQIRISGVSAYFPNHRGANNQPKLRICLAVSQILFCKCWVPLRDFKECSVILVADRNNTEAYCAI